ncbi:hypothetical protein [Anaerovibrio sp.]|uniref:hypothetical protein n=1 Tax=Anaerovibrio sp. TaxID=1872532 RepID=UPI00388EA993
MALLETMEAFYEPLDDLSSWANFNMMSKEEEEAFLSKWHLYRFIDKYEGKIDREFRFNFHDEITCLTSIFIDVLYTTSEEFSNILGKLDEYRYKWFGKLKDSFYGAKSWNKVEFTDIFSKFMLECWELWDVNFASYFLLKVMSEVAEKIFRKIAGREPAVSIADYLKYEGTEKYMDRFYFIPNQSDIVKMYI